MRLLVTGARGFIGAGVVRAAHAEGHQVLAVDSSTSGRPLPEGVELIQGDITRPAGWRSAFDRIDTVVHCAAIHRPDEIASGAVRSIEVNLRGTRLMLEHAAASGVRRFVHLSSAKAYGEPLGFPSHEDDLLNPVESYGLAKAVTEDYCRHFARRTAMRCLCVRPFSVYGPGQDFSTGYIGQLLEAWLSREKAVFSGHAGFLRDFVHIDDVVDVCLAAAYDEVSFDTVNVGSGHATKLGELVELFASLSGEDIAVDYKPARPGTIERTLADVTRQMQLLNRRPTPLNIGLSDTIKALKQGATTVA